MIFLLNTQSKTNVSEDVASTAGPTKDTGRRRDFGKPARKGRGGRNKRDEDSRNAGRTTLRISTGRKGRNAELSQRRGSLKKRDRRAEKEAKAEAALERKTVSLPE